MKIIYLYKLNKKRSVFGISFFLFVFLFIIKCGASNDLGKNAFVEDREGLKHPHVHAVGENKVVIPAHRSIEDDTTVNVLSLDGGGVKGVISSRFLAKLEKLSGRSVADLFDLIVGTSTGGILALGLTKPFKDDGKVSIGISHYTAEEMTLLYRELATHIFPEKGKIKTVIGGVIWGYKYYPHGLEKKLKEIFMDEPLSLCRTPLVITSVDSGSKSMKLFRSHRARHSPTENFLKRDVGRATSAAPTYLPSAEIEGPQKVRYSFVDGGMGANNPALVALAEAYALYGHRKVNLVSVGTGKSHKNVESFLKGEARNRGFLRWGMTAPDTCMDAQSSLTESFLGNLTAGSCRSPFGLLYHRFQVAIDDSLASLDNSSEKNLDNLIKRADDELDDPLVDADIRKLVAELGQARPVSKIEQEINDARKKGIEEAIDIQRKAIIMSMVVDGLKDKEIASALHPDVSMEEVQLIRSEMMGELVHGLMKELLGRSKF